MNNVDVLTEHLANVKKEFTEQLKKVKERQHMDFSKKKYDLELEVKKLKEENEQLKLLLSVYKTNEESNHLSFNKALEAMKKGDSIKRASWSENKFIYFVKSKTLQDALKYGFGEYHNEPVFLSTIALKDEDNQISLGWKASDVDVLSNDWLIVGKTSKKKKSKKGRQ